MNALAESQPIEEYVPPAEVAKQLHLSVLSIYRRCKKGEIPALRIGRTWRIPRREFNQFMVDLQRKNTRQ